MKQVQPLFPRVVSFEFRDLALQLQGTEVAGLAQVPLTGTESQ